MSEIDSMRPRRSLRSESRRTDDGVVVRLNGQGVQLDGPAGMFWRLFDGRRSVAEVAAAVAASYDVDAEMVGADAREFVEDMIGRGLLVADA
jgi:hypothetical protein